MKASMLFAAIVTAAAMLPAGSAGAYNIDFRGTSRASPQLKLDMLKTMQRYAKATSGCSMIFSVETTIMPAGFRSSSAVRKPGGHIELWDANVCAKKQMFIVSMWPSPRGGTEFVVAPQGRRPLYN